MSVIKCIFNYFKKHRIIFVFTLLVIISVTFLSLVPPQLLKIIVDDLSSSNNISHLWIYALLYMLIFIAIGIINFLKEILLVIISQGVGKRIRLEMLTKVNRLSYKNFAEYDYGTLEAYFSNDVEEINTLITSGVISMIIDSFKIIGIIISIFIFSYLFGLITLAIIPFLILFVMWIRKRMYKAQKTNRTLEGKVNNLVLENLDNINTIKTFRIYNEVKEKYDNILKNHFKTNQKSNIYDALFSPVMQILKTLLIVLIIVISTANNSVFGLSIGTLASSIDLITNLFSPIENLGMELQTIQKSFAAINRINEFFKLEEDEKKDQDCNIDKKIVLEFKDVTFSYDGKENVIENFNLKLENNMRLTLKGKSGSGKSTLFKLAYGLIKPTKGQVTINGVETYRLSETAKRKIFGIVYQDYYFSGGTIKEEVTLLNPEISDEQVYKILKLVELDRIKDINVPLKINDYSTGELSLFNIARAIIMNSKILFLDEMNAKIDQVTAQKIINVINNVAKDKIILSINHYGHLLENSDILNLEKENTNE